MGYSIGLGGMHVGVRGPVLDTTRIDSSAMLIRRLSINGELRQLQLPGLWFRSLGFSMTIWMQSRHLPFRIW